MKRIITLTLSLIILLNCIPFVAVAETAPAVELYYYDGDTEVAIGTGYATFAEAIAALNADTADNRHFLIRLNADATLASSNRTITNTNFSTSRTVTVDGKGKTLELTAHNGIYVGPEDGTKEINLNIKNLEIYHQSTGSAIQYCAPGTLSTTGCIFTADGQLMTESDKTANSNYAIVNALVSCGQKCTMNFKNTKFNISRQSNFTSSNSSAAVIRTGNGNNIVDVNIDNCTIDTSEATGGVIPIYATNANSTVNISITDAEIYTPPGVYAITTSNTGASAPETVSLSLGRMGFMNKVDNIVTVIYEMDNAINPNGGFKKPTKFTGYTTIGGYNTFPDLVITEVHLESIDLTSGAGPINSANTGTKWDTMAWWGSGHPTATNGSVAGEFFRYIEVYNASSSRINLYDYNLVIDTDALESGSQVNVINIGSGAVGSAQNPAAAYLNSGETAIIWLYNAVDEYLLADADNFRGYYGWRYAGDDATVTPTPAAKDEYLNVDLTDTLVIAANDISGNNSKTETKLGDFKNDFIFYGLIKNNAGEASDDQDNWTSWAYFEHYSKTGGNQEDQSTFNFLYGLDAGGDIREGRRLNEGRVTYNCNPGLLQEVQKLNFPNTKDANGNSVSFTPEITITEINNYMSGGKFDYIEVANISSETINIYDYCILGRYDILGGESDFSIHYFDRVNYIIPGDNGMDIQSYTSRQTQTVEGYDMSLYTGANRQKVYANPETSAGTLAPGETAILWMYDIQCYDNSTTLEEFKNYYNGSIGSSTKIFAMSGFRNQQGDVYNDASGTARSNYSIGISNSSCEIYGIARLDSFETTAADDASTKTVNSNGAAINYYPEIKKEQLSYENTTLTRTGFSILECDCAVFMYSSMINGGGKTDATLDPNGNVAYQYAAAYVDGAALRFAGFLSTLRQDNAGSVITDEWHASPNQLIASQSSLISTFATNLYTVTFEQNGGTGELVRYFVRPEHPVELPEVIYTNGSMFLVGWSTDPSATKDSASFLPIGATIEITGNTTYYAVWDTHAGDLSYTVTVPSVMTIGESGAGSIVMSAELLYFIAGDELEVTVSSANGFYMALASDPSVKVRYSLKSVQNGAETSLGEGGTVAIFTHENTDDVYIDAELTGDVLYAGTYEDVLTFTITLRGATR